MALTKPIIQIHWNFCLNSTNKYPAPILNNNYKRDLKYSYFNIKNAFIKFHLKEDIFLVLLKGVTITINKVLKA